MMSSDDVVRNESQPLYDHQVESPRTPAFGKAWSPTLQPLYSEPRPRRRKIVRYILLGALVAGIIIAVVCAAVLVTRNKHRGTSSTPTSPDSSSTPAGQTPANSTVQDDIQTMTSRRLSVIVGGLENATDVPGWISTLGPDGKWPATDVDYTAGCTAQNANWPASDHWVRIENMAAAWHGGFTTPSQLVNNNDLRTSISRAMAFWFSNDFSDTACLVSGGEKACGCNTPGLWNPNWFANVILVPKLVAPTCLLLNGSLTPAELGNCTKISNRAYGTFNTGIVGGGAVTGANTLDIATIGIDNGLLTSNMTLLSDAFNRVHAEVVVQNTLRQDGIRADGSFAQHEGIIYNGNYGKDYTNDAVALEIEAADTRYQASGDSRNAFQTLIDGDQWMIYRNTLTNVLHWDFSVLGRFISLPVIDGQATAQINLNLTQIQVLGQLWGSDTLTEVYNGLTKNTTDANAGELDGNRMFYANDYMVNRGPGYVSTLRMYSSRTRNTECVNTQNPFGFHLSDGTMYTYLSGDEYEDIAAAWDWNLIPGTTVDYGATQLSCGSAGQAGLQAFVGGASDGSVGVAAMQYQNPLTKQFGWQKTWFFLSNDVQHIMIPKVTSATKAPVFSVLDQRKHDGDVVVDNAVVATGNYSNASSLWHGGVGYSFNPQGSVSLSIEVGPRTGAWTSLGSSHQPPATVDLFAAWLDHLDLTRAVSYSVFPGTTAAEFQSKLSSTTMQSINNDASVSAMTDNGVAFAVFWGSTGGSIEFPTSGAPVTVTSNGPSIVILRLSGWNVTVSDPTQTLPSLTLGFTLGSGATPSGWSSSSTSTTLNVPLPTGGTAGSSVTQPLFSS